VISKRTKIDTLFDMGSQANLVSKDIVKKLDLETTPHPKPYPLGWICHNVKFHVTRRCKLRFSIIANYIDEVDLDFIPLDICGIVFGSPYLYDSRSIFHRHENKYHLFKNGVVYIVRAHTKKMNLSLTNVGQMKRLVNASRNLVILMTKPKDDDEEQFLKGCDAKLQSDLYEVDNENVEMFQEPRGLPPKRGVQQEIILQQGGPLPNIDMCRMSDMENVENRKQAQELLDKRVIKPSTSPCRSPIGLVPKKDCMWQMWVDFKALNKTTDTIDEGDMWKKDLRSKQASFHALTSYVFHLVIRYKKYFYDKVVDMLTRPIVSALVIYKHNIIMHEIYWEQYAIDVDFKYFYATLCHANQVEELDSYVHGKLLYLGKLCFSQGESVNMIREVHSSLVVGHFGMGKTVARLQSKNPKFWVEHLHYFQHSYNQAKNFIELV
jgi:hypothetical protein